MNTRRILNVGFGAVRIGVGVVAETFPEKLGRTWIGDEAESPRTRVILQALGARDLALGIGTVEAALRDDSKVWLAVSVLADFSDLATTVISRRNLPREGVLATSALAGSAVVAGSILLALEMKAEPA